MIRDKNDLYNPNYPYKKDDVTISDPKEGYPIVERTDNALLYPETPKDDIDFEMMK